MRRTRGHKGGEQTRSRQPWRTRRGAFEPKREVLDADIYVLSELDRPGRESGKDVPNRYEATKALVAKLGGRLVSAYVTTRQYDVALTVEMPNGDAMTKLAVAITSSGNARTTTVRDSLRRSLESLPPRRPDRIAAFVRWAFSSSCYN